MTQREQRKDKIARKESLLAKTNLVIVLGSIDNLVALGQTFLVFLVQHSKQWLERRDACKPLQRHRNCEDRMHVAQSKTLVGKLKSKRKRGSEAEIRNEFEINKNYQATQEKGEEQCTYVDDSRSDLVLESRVFASNNLVLHPGKL